MDSRDCWRNGADREGRETKREGGGCGTTGVGFYERPGVDLWSCGLFKVETTPPPLPPKYVVKYFTISFLACEARFA